jgi:O-methyltransferase involved in polyketide biosynthesis
MKAVIPSIPAAAAANRGFLGRAVTAVAEAGVRQFADIGSGLPTQENTHQVLHRIDPAIRVAYVDNDPQAVTRGRALLQETGQDTVRVIDADLRQPDELVPRLSDFIDFAKPACLVFAAVMHFVPEPACYRIMHAYIGQMAPGSYLVLSHSTADRLSPEGGQTIHEQYRGSNAPIYLRTRDEVTRFFDGTTLLEPGVTDVADWRAGERVPQTTLVWGGVGMKAAA